jgi:hypothetical protein
MWKKLVTWQEAQSVPAGYIIPIARGRRKDEGDTVDGRPEMFDAWTERRSPNTRLKKWEEYTVSASPHFGWAITSAYGPLVS